MIFLLFKKKEMVFKGLELEVRLAIIYIIQNGVIKYEIKEVFSFDYLKAKICSRLNSEVASLFICSLLEIIEDKLEVRTH